MVLGRKFESRLHPKSEDKNFFVEKTIFVENLIEPLKFGFRTTFAYPRSQNVRPWSVQLPSRKPVGHRRGVGLLDGGGAAGADHHHDATA